MDVCGINGPASRIKMPVVAHLSSGFGVKRRAVENNLHVFAGLRLRHRAAVLENRENLTAARRRLPVAFEFGLLLLGQLPEGGQHGSLFRALPRRPRPLALLLHLGFKRGPSNFKARITANIFDEIAWKSVGVVESKGLNPPQRPPPRGKVSPGF